MNKKNKSYFMGWYYKIENKQETIGIIPAFHINNRGVGTCSIQIITKNNSFYVEYPLEKMKYSKYFHKIKIGNSVFGKNGFYLNIKNGNKEIKGNIEFKNILKPKKNIMGPFKYLSNILQCNHQIISYNHDVYGKIIFNQESINFNKGTGYIEMDAGCSFPKNYFWSHCNFLDNNKKSCSIMVAIADISMWWINFKGCICGINYNNKEYILSTYNGVKIIQLDENTVSLIQDKIKLNIQLFDNQSKVLKAPQEGQMIREIKECIRGKVKYDLFYNNKNILSKVCENASIETVGNGWLNI